MLPGMHILESYSFRGYRRGRTPRDGCVGLLKSLKGDEIVLALVDPTASAHAPPPPTEATPNPTASAAAAAAARTDLDIEFVLSSSSSAWGSSFSSVDGDALTSASPDTDRVVSATESAQSPPPRPSHGATFKLSATASATASPSAELVTQLRRAYGPEVTSLWWVLLGYSPSGDSLYFCPHHARLAAEQSAVAAVAPLLWRVAASYALFSTAAGRSDGALVDITAEILRGDAATLAPCGLASHHFMRVPVGCCALPSSTGASADVALVWSPPLDTSVLSAQFAVSGRPRESAPASSTSDSGSSAGQLRHSHAYVLAKTDRTPVHFVGVALGIPWVIDAEGGYPASSPPPTSFAVSNLSLSLSPPDVPTFLDLADPLPGCYQADSLVREFGLRGSQPPTPPPAPPARTHASVTDKTDVVDGAADVAPTVASQSYTDAPTDTARPPVRAPSSDLAPPSSSRVALPATSARPVSSLPYFVKGRKIAVPGPFGVLLECDVSPAVLEKRFGVAHADRLRLRGPIALQKTALTAAEWEELEVASHSTHEGPLSTHPPLYVTVMGVAMSAPVVLFDDARKAVMLRTVRGVDGMRARFVKVAGSTLAPPALPIEPEMPTSLEVPRPPRTPPAAYDDFRSSTSSSDADEPAEGPVEEPVEESKAVVSPSATPSQLPGEDEDEDADAEAVAPSRRDPSLAPTELHGAAPPAAPAEEAPSTAEEDVWPEATRARETGGAPEVAAEAVAPPVDVVVNVDRAPPPHRRDSSASPGITLPAGATRPDKSPTATPDSAPNSPAPPAPLVEGSCATLGTAASVSGSGPHSLTNFLKAYALYQLERDERLAGHELGRHLTIHALQQYYQAQPLKRVLSAMEAQRRCLWLWGREGFFASPQQAEMAWAELCVDEVAEYLLAKETILMSMIAK